MVVIVIISFLRRAYLVVDIATQKQLFLGGLFTLNRTQDIVKLHCVSKKPDRYD